MIAIAPLVLEKRCGLIGVVEKNIDIPIIVIIPERGSATDFFGEFCQSDLGGRIGEMMCAVLSTHVTENQIHLRVGALGKKRDVLLKMSVRNEQVQETIVVIV